ncbi:MAG: class I SAM-dependent methyltransferase, partial [Deltaproteobacteria bacterium]|nr:class I SAM-dependent methyltransferase [Deltaproteobacteria bacterium]
CEALDQFFDRVLSTHHDKKVPPSPAILVGVAKARLLNRQNKQRSLKVAKVHYNIGNAFYEAMLDPYMQYTCAYWNGATQDLASAQEAKLDLICRKLALAPGEKILELGCGWGGFARYAAHTTFPPRRSNGPGPTAKPSLWNSASRTTGKRRAPSTR